jgi:hypothetical protein
MVFAKTSLGTPRGLYSASIGDSEHMQKTAHTSGSVSEFVQCVNAIREQWFDNDDPWGPWFRGQQHASWGLSPKLYRDYGDYKSIKNNRVEDEIREEFATRAPNLSDTPIEGGAWERYFLMQHFGAPTRLLDWSEGALIALYFAVRDSPGYSDGAVWALDPYELNKRAIGLEEVIPPGDPGVTARDQKRIAAWLPERFRRRSTLPRSPVAVYPTHTMRRISAQRSCFTIHGTDGAGLDKLNEPRCLVKIVIPGDKVSRIKRELETSGIDEATIFPDLDGLGRTVCARWKVNTLAPPHASVYARLRPSKMANAGVGVFAVRRIRKGTHLFVGDDEEMRWVDKGVFSSQPKSICKLYEDFAVFRKGRYGCPRNFNVLTLGWYLNEPESGTRSNVACDEETYDFFALRDIRAGEELTVDYSTYSETPPGDV